MCEKKIIPVTAAQEASGALAGHLLWAAEKELSAFYAAILSSYGPEVATEAAYDWMAKMEKMAWPLDGSAPQWRHISMIAAACAASRIIEHPSNH